LSLVGLGQEPVLQILLNKLKELLLGDDLLVAAHLGTVVPAALLAPSGDGGVAEQFFVIFSLLWVLLVVPDEAVITANLVWLAVLPGVALVCGLVAAEVAALDPQVVGGWNHESKAHNHVEVADHVVEPHDVAADTQWRIDAVVDLARSHWDRGHSDPANEESVQPHVEDKHEVVADVLSSDRSIGPHREGFVLVDALATHIAVLAPWRPDDLADKTKVLTRNAHHNLLPVQLGVSLDVAWALGGHHAKGNG
jgi:hypothetical protein